MAIRRRRPGGRGSKRGKYRENNKIRRKKGCKEKKLEKLSDVEGTDQLLTH